MARILLIDKDLIFSAKLSAGLRLAGHSVETAGSGEAAMLELAAQTPFDLVITDLLAPELDGFDLIVTVAETRPDTPILALFSPLAGSDLDQSLIARALGAFQAIEKPVEPAAVTALVGSLFPARPVECSNE
jgi:DNA-binding response OmpR family regulator